MFKYQNFKLLLKSFYGLIMLARNPQNTNYVFILGNAQDKLAENFRLTGKIDDPFRDEQLQKLFEEKYTPNTYDLDQLSQLPEDSLGYQYAQHMRLHNLKVDFYKPENSVQPMHYLRQRIRKTHDIWHLVTGFDTSQNGEIGLQGFYFAQFSNGQSALIFGGGIIRSVLKLDYQMTKAYIDQFIMGYNLGKKAQNLLPIKWEELWSEPILELKKRFRIA